MSGNHSSVFVRNTLGDQLLWTGRLARVAWACLLATAVSAPAWAQPAPPAAPAGKLPAPVQVALDTSTAGDPAPMDLKATDYPSALEEDAIPVILLHMYKGSSADYSALIPPLQEQGYAVIVPDLRGHGGSTKFQNGGQLTVLQAAGKDQLQSMFQYDVEACRIFLQSKKNVNVDKLCVVGAEMGAVLALNYAAWDWHWPPLGGKKQGQHVKALALISPDMNFKSLSAKQAMATPAVRSSLSVLMIVSNSKGDSGAKRLDKILAQNHPTPAKPQDKDYWFVKVNTSLKGTEMLGKQLKVESAIARFIDLRLNAKKTQAGGAGK